MALTLCFKLTVFYINYNKLMLLLLVLTYIIIISILFSHEKASYLAFKL